MPTYRKVNGAYPGHAFAKNGRTRLTRVIGKDAVPDTFPVMLLEVVESETTADITEGFPWQPYANIESFLYFLDSKRDRRHAAADLQTPSWVYSAYGEYTEQIPAFDTPVIGVQLWVWAPDGIPGPLISSPGKTVIPTVQVGGATVRVVAGSFADQLGAVMMPISKITYLDIFLPPKEELVLELFEDDPLLAYVLEGDAYFGEDEDELYPEGRALTFSPGQQMVVHATRHGVRFLLVHAPDAEKSVPPLDMSAVQQNDSNWTELVDAD